MNMNGGIDSQVQQAQLSAGSDPQALQQRYQKTRSIIDLLAMQKVTNDKKKAAQEIQAKMQQNPATIADQREQELMAMTQQEMMQKMGPTMQRTGQESARQAVQQGQMPQQQGITSQANAPMGMREGGIVPGFAGPEGSLVEPPNGGREPIEWKKALELLKQGMPISAISEMFPNLDKRMWESASKIRKAQQDVGPIGGVGAGIASIPSLGGGLMEDFYEKAKILPEGMSEHVLKPLIGGFTGNTEPQSPKPPAAPNQGAITDIQASLADGDLQMAPPTQPEAPGAVSGAAAESGYASNYNPALTDQEKETQAFLMKTMGVSAEDAYEAARARTAATMKPAMDEARQGIRDTTAIRENYAKVNDPKKQRKDRLMAALLAPMGSSFAGGLQNAGIMGQNQRKQNEYNTTSGLAAIKNAQQVDTSNLTGLLGKEDASGQAAFGDTKTKAMEAARNSVLNSANIRNSGVQSEANALRAQYNRIAAKLGDESKLSAALTRQMDSLEELKKELYTRIDNDTAMTMAVAKRAKGLQEGGTRGQELVDVANAEIAAITAQYKRETGYQQQYDQMTAHIRKLETQLGIPTVAPNSNYGNIPMPDGVTVTEK